MANILHLEADRVYLCVAEIRQGCVEMRSMAQELAVKVRSMNWHGLSREMFEIEMGKIVVLLTQLADEGEALSMRASSEIEQWSQLDLKYSHHFSEINIGNNKF